MNFLTQIDGILFHDLKGTFFYKKILDHCVLTFKVFEKSLIH